MKKLFFTLPLIILILILFIFVLSLLYSQKDISKTLVEIEKGSNVSQIASLLQKRGIIDNKTIFYYYLRLTRESHELNYGNYLFDGEYSMIQVIQKIKSGKVVLHKLTIPEGLTKEKTCKLLSKKGFGDYEKYISLCNDAEYARNLTKMEVHNLEGFLYPETYFFPDDVSETFIISHLVESFFKQTENLDLNKNDNNELYEIIILASIVEKEARLEAEKPKIAGVYLNRLAKNHKLQADPTVAYILEQDGKHREKIYYKDLKIDSPFNTYEKHGLPPTPICSPGKKSIEAVINPEKSDLFYFFADGTGGHQFSRTYREHINKQNRVKGDGK